MNCIVCGKILQGKQTKYCSQKCKARLFRTTPHGKEYERMKQYKRNKYVKKPGDTWDRWGDKSPNWKGGRSKDHMHYRRKFVKENPEKIKAQSIVLTAVRNGTLVKEPCKICGKGKVDSHHKDYTKPLEVVWLCRKHHNRANLKLIDV